MRRFLLTVAALILSAALLPGCTQHERFGHDPDITYTLNTTPPPTLVSGRYGGELSAANAGDPKTFNTWVAEDLYSNQVTSLLYDALETQNSFTLQYEPRLAYLPKISKDGLTYTYKLRSGLVWSDGKPLTADDVIFTLDVLFDPKIETLYREGLLISVQQPDGTFKQEPFQYKKLNDHTVQFVLPGPWAPAENTFSFSIMPKHVLQSAYKAGQFNSTWGINTPPSQLVGCGPYLMTQYVAGQRVVYKRNPLFWKHDANGKPLPYFDRYVYNITPDSNQMVLNFRAGGSDVLAPIPLRQYAPFAKYARRDNYTLVDCGPDWGIGFMMFNENPTSTMAKTPGLLKLFQNKLFRQACSYAIDRETLCRNINLGLAHPLWGPETPANKTFYDPATRQYPYNVAKAKQMLAQIGLTPGADGMLTYEGEPVKFNILVPTESSSGKLAATIIQNNLQAVGINGIETPLTFVNLDTKVVAAPYDWQAVMMGFTGGYEPNAGGDLWRSYSSNHIWYPKQKHPATAWEARVDEDFAKGAQALTLADRKKYYNDWQETVAEQQPLLFLTYPEDFAAIRNHFGNIQPTPGDNGVIWNLEEIYDTKAERLTP